MTGPTASILLPVPLVEERVAEIRHCLEERASTSQQDTYWLSGRPFVVRFGEEYAGELDELTESGLHHVLGFLPQDTLGLAALCNERADHHLLGRLCLDLAISFSGVVDFGGMLLAEPVLDAAAPASPVRVVGPSGLAGTLFAASYLIDKGRYGTCHYGDATFLAAWLAHPDFRMVK